MARRAVDLEKLVAAHEQLHGAAVDALVAAAREHVRR